MGIGGFEFQPKDNGEPSLHVVDLGTGEEVHAPGIARLSMESIKSGFDVAGIDFEVPDDISSLLPPESEG